MKYTKSCVHILLVATAVFAFFSFSVTLYAQTDTIGTTSPETSTTTEDTAADTAVEDASSEPSFFERIREKILEQQAAPAASEINRDVDNQQPALDGQQQQRALSLLDNVTRRMHAAIERLQNIAERLERRADKAETAENKDMTDVFDRVEGAHAELSTAAALLEDVPTIAPRALSSEDPRTAFQPIRTNVREAGERIRAAHRELNDSITAYENIWNNTVVPVVAGTTSTTSEDTI